MRNIVLLLVVSCMSISCFSQNRDFVRLGVGGGLSDGGYNIQTEYGRQLKMIEVGVNLNFFSDLPLKSYDANAFDQTEGWFFSEDQVVDGLTMLSLNLSANVDVFYFINQLRQKHMLKIGGGIGGYTFWGSYINPGKDPGVQRAVSFNSEYGFQYILSAKYEYTLTENVSLGLYFDYLRSVNDYPILGVHAKRYF